MSKIEKELMDATGVKTQKDRQKFLVALHTAVMKLPDADWEKLSDPAQKWANAGSKAVEKKEALEDFSDAAAPKAAAKEKPAAKTKTVAEEPEAEQEPAPKASTREKPAAATKEKPAPKEKPTAVKKGPGKIEKIKGIILKNLKLKPDELKAKLIAAGVDGVADSTITTVRSDFLSSIRVLQKAGKLSDDLLDLD